LDIFSMIAMAIGVISEYSVSQRKFYLEDYHIIDDYKGVTKRITLA